MLRRIISGLGNEFLNLLLKCTFDLRAAFCSLLDVRTIQRRQRQKVSERDGDGRNRERERERDRQSEREVPSCLEGEMKGNTFVSSYHYTL
jgi:hypothetical protein